MILETGKTYIDRLRATGREKDPLALRLRLGSTLSAADLQPPGLPPAAILLVRHLRDPLPGGLTSGRVLVGPPAEWQRATSSVLERLARQAARPALGPVPPGAEAVIFDDQAELLACLARDWIEGSVPPHWWWRSHLSTGDAAQAVQSAWLRAPEYVPAALDQMARTGTVVTFVRSMQAETARLLLRRMLATFSLPDLEAALEAPLPDVARSEQLLGDSGMAGPAAAPWEPWAPESVAPGLQGEQRSLLGIGLTVARRLVLARTISFAKAVREWRRSQPSLPPAGLAPMTALPSTPRQESSEQQTPRAESTSPEWLLGKLLDPSEPAHEMQGNPTSTNLPSRSGPADHRDNPLSPSLLLTESHRDEPRPARRSEVDIVPGQAMTAGDGEAAGEVAPVEVPQSTPRVDIVPCLQFSLQTELGGIFYLVNFGICLGLYGDFTKPLAPGIPLSVWDFVALMGEGLIGEQVRRDPVWPLLARLAGRAAGEEPGHGCSPQDRWETVLAEASGLDREDALREDQVPDPVPCSDNPLGSWLTPLLQVVRGRLRRGLGLAQDADPGPLLVKHRARVIGTATHLDVFLSLEELPIQIRLAGLDRDPGWVPAAGTFIAFHFD